MTPVPYPIAYALIDGLSADSMVKHSEALNVFPEVKLIEFEPATKDALKKTDPSFIERVWDDGDGKTKFIKHEGCFINHREVSIQVKPEKILSAIQQLIRKRGWQTEVNQPERILICSTNQRGGEKWIEWRISPANNQTYVSQTVFFSPRGLPGFLYWYLLYPFHIFNFRGLIKSIKQQSTNQ
jgi:hypothetical protein